MPAVLFILALLLQAAPAAPTSPITIFAELNKEITSRRSHPGQDVRLVVTEDIKAADGSVLIPSGAKLSGKLTVAHKRSGSEPSAIGFVVDKAEWKDGNMALNATVERLHALGSSADSSFCGPNLNRGGMSACGGGASTVFVPVPADCSVEKVDDQGQMAFVCKKREVELGRGSIFVLQHVPPKM